MVIMFSIANGVAAVVLVNVVVVELPHKTEDNLKIARAARGRRTS